MRAKKRIRRRAPVRPYLEEETLEAATLALARHARMLSGTEPQVSARLLNLAVNLKPEWTR